MFQRRPRRFRHRSNGRGRQRHGNGDGQIRITPNAFSNNERRNNFRSTQSAEKLLEKYNALAKEAMSSGDKTSGENYLQHADHFMRIVVEKNKNRDQNKVNIIEKTTTDTKPSSENSNINREDITKS